MLHSRSKVPSYFYKLWPVLTRTTEANPQPLKKIALCFITEEIWTEWWIGKKNRDRGRTHVFLELELARCVTLQSQGDSLPGPSAFQTTHQQTDLTLVARCPRSFPSPSLPASRAAEWQSRAPSPARRGPGRGGSAARAPVRGSGARAFPAGAQFGASRPGPHITGALGPGHGGRKGGMRPGSGRKAA